MLSHHLNQRKASSHIKAEHTAVKISGEYKLHIFWVRKLLQQIPFSRTHFISSEVFLTNGDVHSFYSSTKLRALSKLFPVCYVAGHRLNNCWYLMIKEQQRGIITLFTVKQTVLPVCVVET